MRLTERDEVEKAPEDLIVRLLEDLEWAAANEWKEPARLQDDLREAARIIKGLEGDDVH